jgi:hypothetical protein
VDDAGPAPCRPDFDDVDTGIAIGILIELWGCDVVEARRVLANGARYSRRSIADEARAAIAEMLD